MTVEPVFRIAETRPRFGSPVRLKKTAVRTSVGTMTSAVEVLVRVTIRRVPDVSNVADAALSPVEKVNVTGAARLSRAPAPAMSRAARAGKETRSLPIIWRTPQKLVGTIDARGQNPR